MPTFTQKFEDFLDNNHPGGYMSTSINISDSDLDARIIQNINGRGFLTSTSHLPWNQIDNKPTLFSGSYNDLTNKPTLFSGNYNDLNNKPTIPTISISNTLNSGTKIATITINGTNTDLYVDNNSGGQGGSIIAETDPYFSNSPAANITLTDISNWNNKSNFNGNYNSLINIPSSFPTSDIVIYNFSNAINNTLKYFNTGYFDATTQFMLDSDDTIEDRLNLIIDDVFDSNFKKIIKIITSQGPFILTNLFNYNNSYTFSFMTTSLTNYTAIDQTGLSQQEILDSIHVIFMTCTLVWDTSTRMGYLINYTSRSE